MMIEIPCPDCNGIGYFEYDAGGGFFRKEYCEKCRAKGYLWINEEDINEFEQKEEK